MPRWSGRASSWMRWWTKAGWRRPPVFSRGYRLAAQERSHGGASAVPLVGEIQAGDLRTAVEDPEGYVLAETRFSPRDLLSEATA